MKNKLREELLKPYIKTGEPNDDYRSFWQMPLIVLQSLIDLGCVDTNSWNTCPGVEQMFLPFLKRNPSFTAHGYVISEDREDTRITVEGVERDAPLTIPEIIDFCNTFMDSADDVGLDTDYAYCWYD